MGWTVKPQVTGVPFYAFSYFYDKAKDAAMTVSLCSSSNVMAILSAQRRSALTPAACPGGHYHHCRGLCGRGRRGLQQASPRGPRGGHGARSTHPPGTWLPVIRLPVIRLSWLSVRCPVVSAGH